MKAKFYDVKNREMTNTDVTGKTSYTVKGKTRYAIKGKTSDGRNLTKFVSKSDWDSFDVPTV
jgi:hypothetical protein